MSISLILIFFPMSIENYLRTLFFPPQIRSPLHYLNYGIKFTKGIEEIPTSHQENLNLWLDHFDTAMQCFMSQIPSPYSRDIFFL